MQNHHGRVKAKPQSVVFVTQQKINRWYSDPGDPDSIPKFLGDCKRSGYPVFQHPDGTAYVFAPEVPR